MTEESIRWNRFIEDVCYRDITTLSRVQRIKIGFGIRIS